MTIATPTFDDFSSSKKRQQRITRVAICCGIICAFVFAFQFMHIEKSNKLPSGTLATIKSFKGKLLIKRGPDTLPYEPGFMVLAGDALKTMDDTTLLVSYLDDGTEISLGANTTLRLGASEGGKRTTLTSGTAEFKIAQQPESKPMVLASYNADATVLRSGVIIQKYSGTKTYFEVRSGQIQVRRYSDGQVTDVNPGETHTCQPADSGIIQFDPDGLE